jgi:hypothetical protein
MRRLQFFVFLLSFTAMTAFSQIRYVPLAPPKHIPELSGVWVADEKQNKKLLRKAKSEMRKKMMAGMPKPPAGAGMPRGGGMPGGGMSRGEGMPSGGGMRGGAGRMPMREMPKLEEIAFMVREEIDFALPLDAPLHMRLDESNMNFVSKSGQQIAIPLSGKPQVLVEGLSGFGLFTSVGYTIEFNTGEDVSVAYTYWLEEKDVLKVRTEISKPMMPMPLTFDRVFRRKSLQ